MGRFARATALTVAAAGLSGVLAACSTANISDVYMALDGNGNRKRDVFYTDTVAIHCVVEAGIGRNDATIQVLVRQLQAYDFVANRFFDTNRVTANIEAAPGAADGTQLTDLELDPALPAGSDTSSDDTPAAVPFQVGHFQCEAYLDGVLEKTAIYNVDFPPCPSSTITPTSTCFGFYPLGTVCNAYGLTSTDPAQCTCDLAGWVCP